LLPLVPIIAPVVGLAIVSLTGSLESILIYVFGGWVVVMIVSFFLVKSLVLVTQSKQATSCSAKNKDL
jgi:hypothetical protein